MTIYSYSRINTYFTCPAQFQFRYIERRPSPVAEGVELFLGSRFHETMEYLYEQINHKVPTVNELVNYFNQHWEKHWQQSLQKQKERNFKDTLRIAKSGQTVEDYFHKGQLFVENYFHQYHPFDQDKTEGIELKVAFNLDPKGEFKMQGFIDRLGRDEDGTLWIHDYKTSARKMSEEDARGEDQLALYQAGLYQNPRFGPKEKFKLLWHFVAFEKDQVIGERNPKEIDWLKQKYIAKIETIEKAKSYSTKTSILCKWCEYLTVCSDGKAWVKSKDKNFEEEETAPVAAETLAPSLTTAAENLADAAGSVAPSVAGTVAVFGTVIPSGRKRIKIVSTDQLSLF
jgi:putative RecB family exonuclease